MTGRRWDPGFSLPVHEDIVFYHANWTVGLANKIAQLRHVKEVVDRRLKQRK